MLGGTRVRVTALLSTLLTKIYEVVSITGTHLNVMYNILFNIINYLSITEKQHKLLQDLVFQNEFKDIP